MNSLLTTANGSAPASNASLAAAFALNTLISQSLAQASSPSSAPTSTVLPALMTMGSDSSMEGRRPLALSATAHIGTAATAHIGTALAAAPRAHRSRSAANQTTKRSMQSGSHRNRRFLVLIQIILMDLQSTNDLSLKRQVRWIVRECNRSHRSGDPGFRSLQQSIEILLKATIGETRWNTANQRLHNMLLKRRRQVLRLA